MLKFAARRSAAVWLSRQAVLPYRTRRSIIKKLYPDMMRDYPFVRPFFDRATGLKFSGNLSNSIDRMIYFFGVYEKYALCMMRDYVHALRKIGSHELVFLDVGANVGNHSLFMSGVVDRVLAFEPFERVRKQFEANLSINHVENVRVFPFALSDHESVLPFYAAADSNLGASSFDQHHYAESHLVGNILLRPGDAVLAEANISRLDVVKVDVEGFERPVLEGLRSSLNDSRPLIIVEFTETTYKSVDNADVFRALFPADYQFFYFSKYSRRSGGYRLASYHYGMRPRNENLVACPSERVQMLLGAEKD